MNETVNQETTAPAAEEQQPERTFTQAEVNAMIQDRLARERAKYADYDALRTKAAQFDTVQEASNAALKKATERGDELQKQVDELTAANTLRQLHSKVALETGVPAELLTGETEEACQTQAAAILKFAKPGYPAVKDNGEPVRTHSSSSTRDQFAEWFEQTAK